MNSFCMDWQPCAIPSLDIVDMGHLSLILVLGNEEGVGGAGVRDIVSLPGLLNLKVSLIPPL
jgi:hypothetical protein